MSGAAFMAALLHIVIVVLIGWILGFCAELLVPGSRPKSFVGTTLVGIGGAIFGALVGRQLGWWHRGEVPGFLLSLFGAILLLAIWRLARHHSA
jgi:uncharacterized membrane protein YeaQ/YmgE (transglycosylase-associated protein family)